MQEDDMKYINLCIYWVCDAGLV